VWENHRRRDGASLLKRRRFLTAAHPTRLAAKIPVVGGIAAKTAIFGAVDAVVRANSRKRALVWKTFDFAIKSASRSAPCEYSHFERQFRNAPDGA